MVFFRLEHQEKFPSYDPPQLNNENTHKRFPDLATVLFKQISKFTAESFIVKFII